MRFAGISVETLESAVIGRHRKKVIREAGRLQQFETLQARILISRDDDHGRLAMTGHGLRRAARRFDDRAEAVLGILDRPCGADFACRATCDSPARKGGGVKRSVPYAVSLRRHTCAQPALPICTRPPM